MTIELILSVFILAALPAVFVLIILNIIKHKHLSGIIVVSVSIWGVALLSAYDYRNSHYGENSVISRTIQTAFGKVMEAKKLIINTEIYGGDSSE